MVLTRSVRKLLGQDSLRQRLISHFLHSGLWESLVPVCRKLCSVQHITILVESVIPATKSTEKRQNRSVFRTWTVGCYSILQWRLISVKKGMQMRRKLKIIIRRLKKTASKTSIFTPRYVLSKSSEWSNLSTTSHYILPTKCNVL